MRYSRNFTIHRKDTLRFYQSLALRRWCKGILVFAVIGALVAKLYLDWLGFTLDTFSTALVMLLCAILTAVLITLGTILRTRQSVTAAMRKKGRETYVQETRIDGFGVHVTVEKNSANLSFDKILRVQETNSAFYIFLTENDAWLLPKSQMEDGETESRTIREIFSKVVAPGRLKLKK